MGGRLVVFVRQYPDFDFHLPEYIESSRFISQARCEFDRFCGEFEVRSKPERAWSSRLEELAESTRDVPAYETIDWRAADAFHGVPLIGKEEVRTRLPDFTSRRYRSEELWIRETSGTTGRPMTVLYSPKFFFDFQLLSIPRVARIAGALTTEALSRPVLCLAPHDKKYLTNRVWGTPDDREGLFVRPTFDENDEQSTSRLQRLMEQLKPAFLTLKPNMLEFMVRHQGSDFAQAASCLNLIISGGANLDEQIREEAQELTGVPVINTYGLTEFGFVASECSFCDGLHVCNDSIIAEILGADGSTTEFGFGELVLSSGLNDAMPFLRYRTGDIAELTRDPCPCGRGKIRLKQISGRILKNFRLPDHSECSPTDFDVLLKKFAIREFRITQSLRTAIRAEIELLRPCDGDGVVREVAGFLREAFRHQCLVKVDVVTFSSEGKFQRYVVGDFV